MMKRKPKDKSPIKKKNLRFPGQSLSEELDDLLYDKVFLYIVMSIVAIVFAGMEWVRWYRETPPSPVFITLVAICLTIYSVVRVLLLKGKVRKLKQGRDGERAVGQLLESMRENGCKVLHDLQDWGSKDDDFNIDHVLICDRGVFVIETKTYSKPSGKQPIINFTGDKIFVNNFDNLKIIPQTNAQKQWLEKLILRESGLSFPVKPIVVFPGWFIKGEGNIKAKKHDLWVLEPKALPKFISNLPEALTKDEKIKIANSLSNYVRREQK